MSIAKIRACQALLTAWAEYESWKGHTTSQQRDSSLMLALESWVRVMRGEKCHCLFGQECEVCL